VLPTKPKDLIQRAHDLHYLGHYAGSLVLCRRARMRKVLDANLSRLEALNRFFVGGEHRDALLGKFEKLAQKEPRRHRAQLALLQRAEGDLTGYRTGVAELHQLVRSGSDAYDFYNPNAIVELAELCADDGLLDAARSFVCVGLSAWLFPRFSDLARAGHVLSRLGASLFVWGDWARHLLRHLGWSGTRLSVCRTPVFDDGEWAPWALAEDDSSKATLKQVLSEHGPVGLRNLLVHLALRYEGRVLADILEREFPDGTAAPVLDAAFASVDLIRKRNRWFDSLSAAEQGFIQNGEWAFQQCPTSDYSMGLAQWWRTVEAAFKRLLIAPLAAHLQSKPDRAEADRLGLPPDKLRKEEVFVRILSDPDRARNITLGQILLILQKCRATASNEECQTRLTAARFLSAQSDKYAAFLERTWARPVQLTQENIEAFRNCASHEEPVDLTTAVVGRTLACSLLEELGPPPKLPASFLSDWARSEPSH
jgi:hypothetical protein